MFYKTGYCFTSQDLFDNFNTKLLKIKEKIVTNKYKSKSRKELSSRVLTYCFYLIVLDIIENNITFDFPLKFGQSANIYVKQFSGENFKRMYRKGMFNGIDYLNSNFKGYQLHFQYKHKGFYKEKPIYINSKLKEKFYENVNNGKQYY